VPGPQEVRGSRGGGREAAPTHPPPLTPVSAERGKCSALIPEPPESAPPPLGLTKPFAGMSSRKHPPPPGLRPCNGRGNRLHTDSEPQRPFSAPRKRQRRKKSLWTTSCPPHSLLLLSLRAPVPGDKEELKPKWALESITTNKASGGDAIPVELFQILKNDAVKVLHSICQQIWKTQQWPQDWKGQFSFQSQRKAMPKNAQTTTQLHSSYTLVK